jgi:hypothetical protein
MIWAQGLIAPTGTTSADNTAMVNLPTGWATKLQNHMPAGSSSNYGLVGVGGDSRNTTLNWKPSDPGSVGSGVFISLAGVLFESTDSTLLWTQPFLVNGWKTHGAQYTQAEFVKLPNGVGLMHGLIDSGTLGASGSPFGLPAGIRMGGTPGNGNTALFLRVSNTAMGRLDMNGGGSVFATQSSNLWFTMDAMIWMPEQ